MVKTALHNSRAIKIVSATEVQAVTEKMGKLELLHCFGRKQIFVPVQLRDELGKHCRPNFYHHNVHIDYERTNAETGN